MIFNYYNLMSIIILIAGIGCMVVLIKALIELGGELQKNLKKSYQYKENIKANIAEKLAIQYKEINLTENLKTEENNYKLAYQKDIREFLSYDMGIEKGVIHRPYQYGFFNKNFIDINSIHTFERKSSKFIYAFGDLVEEDYNEYMKRVTKHILELVVLFETKYQNKRMYVGTERFLRKNKNDKFRVLYDSIDDIKYYDKKYLEKHSAKIINKYNGRDFKHDCNYETLELSQFQIDLMDKLAERNSNINFSFSIDNGVARLRIYFVHIYEDENIEEDILFIINTILDEFGK